MRCRDIPPDRAAVTPCRSVFRSCVPSAARCRRYRQAVLSAAHRIGLTMLPPSQLDRCCRIRYQHVCSYPPIESASEDLSDGRNEVLSHGCSDLRGFCRNVKIAELQTSRLFRFAACHGMSRYCKLALPQAARTTGASATPVPSALLKRRQPDDRYWSPGCPVHAMSAKLTSRCCRDARRYEQPCRAANAGSTASHDAHGPCAPA